MSFGIICFDLCIMFFCDCVCVCVCVCVRACACSVTQSCLTLCNPLDCNPPGSSAHGIFQARILEWVASSYSGGSSWPRDRSCIFGVFWMGRCVPSTAPSGKHLLCDYYRFFPRDFHEACMKYLKIITLLNWYGFWNLLFYFCLWHFRLLMLKLLFHIM